MHTGRPRTPPSRWPWPLRRQRRRTLRAVPHVFWRPEPRPLGRMARASTVRGVAAGADAAHGVPSFRAVLPGLPGLPLRAAGAGVLAAAFAAAPGACHAEHEVRQLQRQKVSYCFAPCCRLSHQTVLEQGCHADGRMSGNAAVHATCITTRYLTLILLKGTVGPYALAQQRTTAHLTPAARQHMLSPAGALAAAPRLAVPGAPPALPPPA